MFIRLYFEISRIGANKQNKQRAAAALAAAALSDVTKELLGEIGCPYLADDSYFDLSGIGKAFFDFLYDVTSEPHGRKIIDFFGLNEDANFASGLDGVGLFNALETVGDLFEALEPFEIVVQALAPCTGPRT